MKAIKKFICLILAIVLTFSFSACGSITKEEPTTAAPAPELPVKGIAEAVKSENGALVESYKGKTYSYSVIVDKVRDSHTIDYRISNDLNKTYKSAYGINIASYHLTLDYYKVQDIVKTLQKGDIIYFEGWLDEIYDYGYPNLFLHFADVVITDVVKATS